MFCSECGHKATGKFCSSCGHRLSAAGAVEDPVVIEPDTDWRHSLDYENLIRQPEVRSRIDQAATRGKQGFTGQAFLEVCESVFSPLTGGIAITTLAKIAQPIASKLGWKTSKERRLELADPPGTTLVTLLCYFAEHNYQLTTAQQPPGACILHATVPQDMRAYQGTLIVTVRPHPKGTILETTMTVPGAWYDWGKSQHVLDHLFGELTNRKNAA